MFGTKVRRWAGLLALLILAVALAACGSSTATPNETPGGEEVQAQVPATPTPIPPAAAAPDGKTNGDEANPAPETAEPATEAAVQGPLFLALTGEEMEGFELYKSKGCVACHGAVTEGGVGPSLAGHTPEQVKRQVRNPVGQMPAFSSEVISDQELETLANFIGALVNEAGFTGVALAALQEARQGWISGEELDHVIEELEQAEAATLGEAQEKVREIRLLAEEGKVEEAEAKLIELLGGGPAQQALEDALHALREENLGLARDELQEALELGDEELKEVVEDLLKDLDGGEVDHVAEKIQEILTGSEGGEAGHAH